MLQRKCFVNVAKSLYGILTILLSPFTRLVVSLRDISMLLVWVQDASENILSVI
jgi:hypothetical protein